MVVNQTLISQVLAIAEEAGKIILHFYSRNVAVRQKSDHTPVTDADLFVSQFLIQELQKLTPELPVLSEECCQISLEERQNWPAYWLVDPLDGTQQFINRTGQFGILITLLEKTPQGFQPIFGVIHAPIAQQSFFAHQQGGAFKKTQQDVVPLTCQKLNPALPIKIAVSSSSTEKKLRTLLNPHFQYEFIQYGSSGLKSALVADNQAHCYVRIGKTGEWDTAPAEIILREKQGRVFDFSTHHFSLTPLTYNQRESLINPDFVMLGDDHPLWREIFTPFAE